MNKKGYKIPFKDLQKLVKREYGEKGKYNKKRIFTPESLDRFIKYFEWRGISPIAEMTAVKDVTGETSLQVTSFVGIGSKYHVSPFDLDGLWREIEPEEVEEEDVNPFDDLYPTGDMDYDGFRIYC